MPWTYYRAARAFGLQRLPSLWVWAIIAWTPTLLGDLPLLHDGDVVAPAQGHGLALWATARCLRKGGSRAFLLVVFLWTAAVLTKPTIGPFCGHLWAMDLLEAAAGAEDDCSCGGHGRCDADPAVDPQQSRTGIRSALWKPMADQNSASMQRHGDFREDITHENQNMYTSRPDPVYTTTFCSPSCFVEPFAPFSHWKIQRGREMKRSVIAINSAYGDRDWKNAYNFFDPDLDPWLQLGARISCCSCSLPPGQRARSISGSMTGTGTRWMWAPIVLFVLIGNFRAFLKRRFELLPVAVTCLTLFLALQNVVIFEGRYRKPLKPLLIVNVVWIIATWTIQSTSKPPDATALLTNAEN